ncbi:cytochrome 94A2-like [Capsicum annuum]|uniref:cytochrome P450 94A2-like n=1 Tax=Capsicum annuum TaxID=4072 RepID=UPI001FB09119|nr:cytochrome P450 94A2-like [Capsicum annuum]
MLAVDIESCYYLAFSTLVGLFFLSLFFVQSRKKQVYPKSYPLIGSSLEFIRNRKRIIQWTSEIFDKLSSSTYTLALPLRRNVIFTKDPSNVKHILKIRFNNYHKERIFIEALSDLFRKGLFLSDGSEWKSQRQFFLHDLDPKEFHAYTFVVEEELSGRLVPFLSNAEKTASTIDLQDTFCRFTFDFVCRIGFGFNPEYLLLSMPPTPFADAFKTAVKLSILRFVAGEDLEDKDVLARIVRRAQVSSNQNVEKEIVREIKQKDGRLREMVYTHASIYECMRRFPPIPLYSNEAVEDNVWPDGTQMKKGTSIIYHIFTISRSQELWGSDWADFHPEKWLERRRSGTSNGGDWNFITKDPFTYPVFQVWPRTCLGKEIVVVLMKMVVATILKIFRVIPAPDNFSPHYNSIVVSRMKSGFPVRIIEVIKHSFQFTSMLFVE